MAQQTNLQLTFQLIQAMFPRLTKSDRRAILKAQDGNLARLLCATPTTSLFELKFDPTTFRDLVNKSYLVRLVIDPGEDTLTPCGRFTLAAERQYMASERCPEVVLPILDCDVIKDAGPEGRDLGWMVMPYPDGAIPFSQTMWEDLGPAEQEALMDSIVGAMQRYQLIGLPDDHTNTSRPSADWEMYPPHLGPEKKTVAMNDFLVGLIEADPRPDDGTVRVVDTPVGGLEVVLEEASPFGLRHRVEFTADELEEIQGHAVVCHNDIEPENIMVREEVDPATGAKRFALAAIINWEKAGIFPFAYEFALSDFRFRPDRSYSWYRLFKNKTAAALLPDGPLTDKFIQAIWMILHAKGRSGQLSEDLAARVCGTWAGMCLGAKTLLETGERRGWLGE